MSENSGVDSRKEKTSIKAVTGNVPSPAEFFKTYTLAGVADWSEIHVLGINNVKYLLARVRSMEKDKTNEIDRLQNYKGIFEAALKSTEAEKHPTVACYFEELSKYYDNPQFLPTEIGKRDGGWGDDLEPLTPESETRKSGSTNYNICGWCGHCGGGSCRFSYNITTTCSLLSTYGGRINFEEMEYYGDHTSRELKFNTPCLLKHLTIDQCKGVIVSINRNISDIKLRRDGIRAIIKILIGQRELTGKIVKPWIVSNRPCEYMNIGDPMMAYLGGCNNDKIVQGDWVRAIGVFGYRHHDGCISYQTVFPIHANASYLEGRGGGGGISRPEALLFSEFATLVSMAYRVRMRDYSYGQLMQSTGIEDSDIAFLRIWFKNIEQQELSGFDCVRFYESLKYPQWATPPEDWEPPTEEIKVETEKDAENVLQCLDWKLFSSIDKIIGWADMQLQFVHPEKFQQATAAAQAYATRQTKAVIAARDLLIKCFKERKG